MSSQNDQSAATLRSRLAPILEDLFGIKDLPEDGDLSRDEVPGWDSIGHFHLVMELEREFGIALSDEYVFRLTSLETIEQVLIENGVSQPAAS